MLCNAVIRKINVRSFYVRLITNLQEHCLRMFDEFVVIKEQHYET